MWQLTAWVIRGKRYVVVGGVGPSSLSGWRRYLDDQTLTNKDISLVKSWRETIEILRKDFALVDLEQETKD